MSCMCIALLTEIGFFKIFRVKALIEKKKLARLKEKNDCSQIFQQEVLEGEDLWLQGFVVVNVKIILAL